MGPGKKILKSIGKAIITKRPVKQVFGTAGTIIGGTAITAGVLTNKAKKQFAEEQKKPEVIAKRKANAKLIEEDRKKYNLSKNKNGGIIKTKSKK